MMTGVSRSGAEAVWLVNRASTEPPANAVVNTDNVITNSAKIKENRFIFALRDMSLLSIVKIAPAS
jgi:hypothetical protein